MDGTIVAAAGFPPLDRDRWRTLCKSHPNLASLPSVLKRNPFKPGEMMEVRAPSDSVRIMVSGCEFGTMNWAMDESSIVIVTGNDRSIIPVVQQIAEALSAVFVEDADSSGDGNADPT